MIRYQFRDRPLAIPNATKANAQVIGESIAKITAEHGGQLHPEYLWQAAEGNKRHPLYKHYPWDLREAAESHWTYISRKLIACVDIVGDGNERPKPAFISIATKNNGTSYQTIAAVMESAELLIAALKAAEAIFEAYERRLQTFEDLCSDIRAVREKIRVRRASMESRAHV